TYDDFLITKYDRTIGYMEPHELAPEGFTHYFAVLLKTAEKGKSKPGEIEKAYGDSWVDSEGKMRAFIGNVRANNGVDYDTALFIADIPDEVDITTSFSGDKDEYPMPPNGIVIRRLTHSGCVGGIVRGSYDGKQIAFLSKDDSGINQVAIIDTDGSDLSNDKTKHPVKLTNFKSSASNVRWHPSNDWIFSIINGNIAVTSTKPGKSYGKSIMLTNDNNQRSELVVSPDGNLLAYTILIASEGNPKEFRQIFVMNLDWEEINKGIE
ncbi:MAG: hypothetical protein R3182_12760, partial [Draconibacterium sp.]|nr:hypothetical protein [Draconibacterium sp.]